MPGFCCFLHPSPQSPWLQPLQGQQVHRVAEHGLLAQLNAVQPQVGYRYLDNESLLIYLHGDILSGGGEDPLISVRTAYQQGNLSQLLAQLNGQFALLVVDKRQQRLVIANDRLALKPLYLWQQDTQVLALATESKPITCHPDWQPELDPNALTSFTQVGHMLETQTWFRHLTRLPPATLLTIDTTSGERIEQSQYWSWSAIKKSDLSFAQATDELYHRFVQAMQRSLASVTTPKLAITLSGGLDSRLLLAEAARQYSGTIEAFTFGVTGCDDERIAKQVCHIAGVTHHMRTIDQQSWFSGREAGVWRADGLFNIVHMHTLASVPAIADCSPYLLNGFLGDVVLGGSYLDADHLNQAITPQRLAEKYPASAEFIDSQCDYYQFPCVDPVLINNRGMRFIAAGSELLADRLHNLKPFMDNDVLELVYALPDEYRFNSRLYNAMLLKYYPEYFATIPWQNTGQVITLDWPPSSAPAAKARPSQRIKQQLIKTIRGVGLESYARRCYQWLSRSNKSYANYSVWMRDKHFAAYLKQQLSQPIWIDGQPLFAPQDALAALERFLSDHSVKPEQVGGWLTLAIYLQQLKAARESVQAATPLSEPQSTGHHDGVKDDQASNL